MKLIDSSYEILTQGTGLVGVKKFIEKVGRTCYKSEDRITDVSYESFVDMLIKSNHTAMLEFGTVYLRITTKSELFEDLVTFYTKNEYSKIKFNEFYENIAYITTNYRVIVENNRFEDLKFLCEPDDLFYKRYTVKFIVSRNISHEIVRHRKASLAQESQRFICYVKSRYGGEIKYIIPQKIYDIRNSIALAIDPLVGNSREILGDLTGKELVDELRLIDDGVQLWYEGLEDQEKRYKKLINNFGWKAQEARGSIPGDCATEINVCMYESDWIHFFDLRSLGKTGAPDPGMKVIAEKVMNNMIESGIFDYCEETNILSGHEKM